MLTRRFCISSHEPSKGRPVCTPLQHRVSTLPPLSVAHAPKPTLRVQVLNSHMLPHSLYYIHYYLHPKGNSIRWYLDLEGWGFRRAIYTPKTKKCMQIMALHRKFVRIAIPFERTLQSRGPANEIRMLTKFHLNDTLTWIQTRRACIFWTGELP